MPSQSCIRWVCVALAAAGALGGCAVGPDYRPPRTDTEDTWQAVTRYEALATGPAQREADPQSLADWWTALEDPLLTQLIEQAVTENKTVQAAMARVVEARARRGAAAAPFWPTIGASVSASRTDSEARRGGSEADLPPGAGQRDVSGSNETYSAGLDSSWELDLFGARRRAYQASAAQFEATQAELRDVLVTLLGDIALTYTTIRTTQSRLDYAERNLEAQRDLLEITRWRAEAGLATALDVEQARTSYEQTQAQLPALQSSLYQSMHRLAVLTGQPPGALAELLEERRPIPAAPAEVVTGVPADVIRRRPDIHRAERQLAAQTAQVGVATAALYPSLSLSGFIGLTAPSAGDLFSDGLSSDRLGATLSLPVFRGGALRQNLAAQNALLDQALANYEQTVLTALEEVENALTAWANEQRRQAALVEAAQSARVARELALLRYNSGLVDFQTVLTADRTLLSVEDQLASSRGELTANLIRLYKALGGGWSVFPQ